MGQSLTIVMYHYVRELERSRFPALKGLSLGRFRRQLDYIRSHYVPISIEQLVGALGTAGEELPRNPIVLTFDDGYSDHYMSVFPLLDALGIQGCFFPPAQAILEHRVLDVNKIQFVLAATHDPERLLDQVFSMIEEMRIDHQLRRREEYLSAITGAHRYDPQVVYVLKRLLQHVLPEAVRAEIVQRLFAQHVTSDEAAFASELYMSCDQIACMRRQGMHIGSHGYSHVWLNHVTAEEQANEIDRSLNFLESFGVSRDQWTMCYPYGGFNESLLDILRNRQCQLGFTVEARLADLSGDRLLLARVDTNDLPS